MKCQRLCAGELFIYLIIAAILLQLGSGIYEHSLLGVGLSIFAILPLLIAFKGICIVSKFLNNKIFL
jgi:hypothetical protein